MEESLINQGLELMLFGMGTVIVFLTLLVYATTAMSLLVQKFFPAEQERAPALVSSSTPAVDATTLAVIAAAIHQHRSRR
jgi:oxaloacetate decarboxylase gamma subunit